VLARLAEGRCGVVSTQVLAELYSALTRAGGPALGAERAREAVAAYLAWWPVVAPTAEMIGEAVDFAAKHRRSVWDALIWATARACGAGCVLSEDFVHGRTIEGVQFANPFRDDFDPSRLLQ
jgi:predicted nucleic acid-binding protein